MGPDRNPEIDIASIPLRRAVIAVLLALALWLPAPRAEAARSGYSFQHFVESYETMQPAVVLKLLSALNRTQFQILTSYGALAQDMLLVACQANGGLWMTVQGARVTCQTAWRQQQQALQWISRDQLRQNIRMERDRMLIGLRCATGEIDRASCKAYVGAAGAVNRTTNDTSLRIIENIGNKCRVGVDPGCVAY